MQSVLRVLVRFWPVVLGVGAVIVLGVLFTLWQDAREDALTAEAKAEQAQSSLEETQDQVDRIRASAATSARIAEQLNRGVDEALTQSSDWGAQRTPDGVVVELCQHLRCAEPGSTVRAPSSAGADERGAGTWYHRVPQRTEPVQRP